MLSMMMMALAGFGAVNAQSILDVAQSDDSFSTLVSVIQAAEQPDFKVGDVELPPSMTHGAALRIMVMVVVPAFSGTHERDEPVVPALLVGVVVPVPEEV